MKNHMDQHRTDGGYPAPGFASGVTGSFSSADGGAFIYEIDIPERSGSRVVLLDGRTFQRAVLKHPDRGVDVMTDRFEDGSICEFVRLSIQGQKRLQLVLTGAYDIHTAPDTGWHFRSRDPAMPQFWLPLQPAGRKADAFGRIKSEETLTCISQKSGDDCAAIVFSIPEAADSVDVVIWRVSAGSGLMDEIASRSSREQKRMFLWGSHSPFTGLNDLYQYLIYGAVFKTGAPWTFQPMRRSYCEVVAYALYVTFHSLWLETRKMIYQHMKTQIVMSVIARQDADGAWRHGSWTDDFEVHFRHHCSGIHMLSAYYDETGDEITGSALKQAVDYMRKQHDVLSEGNWYLHDSLELSEKAMRKSPVTYQYSRALGKSPSNMLVLNTHLDALVAFSRYQEVAGQSNLEDEIASGVNAAVAVLGLAPAETFYRVLFRAVELTFLPDSAALTLPLMVRAIRRVAREKLIPILPRIKKIFPRLVMPNGYIDRNLTLNEFWHPYFLINIMDILRFQRRFSIEKVEPVIQKALAFVERVGLEKWLKDERTAYAVAFLAEALYLDCLRRDERSRSALAESVLALDDAGLGIPPSLLGCNPEFIRLSDQVPCPWLDSGAVRVINLSRDNSRLEFIIINSSERTQDVPIPAVYDHLKVLDAGGNALKNAHEVPIPARGWIRLLSGKSDLT